MNPKLIQENINVLKAEYNRMTSSLAQLKEQIQESNTVLVSQREDLINIESLIKERTDYYATLQEEKERAINKRLDILSEEQDILTDNILNLKDIYNEIEVLIKDKQQEVHDLNKDIMVGEGIILEIKEELKTLDDEIDDRVKDKERLVNTVNELIEEKNTVIAETLHQSSLFSTIQKEIEDKEELLDNTLDDIKNAQSILGSLSSQIEQYKKLIADITILESRKLFLKEEVRDAYNKTILAHRK